MWIALATILIAGSETTATALAGITFELLKHPQEHKQLVDEVRSSFNKESDITVASTLDLPYLNAVIEEGLRYCVPAPGFGSRVVPPQGGTVCGHTLPGGVSTLSIHYILSCPLSTRHPSSIHYVTSFVHYTRYLELTFIVDLCMRSPV